MRATRFPVCKSLNFADIMKNAELDPDATVPFAYIEIPWDAAPLQAWWAILDTALKMDVPLEKLVQMVERTHVAIMHQRMR